MFNNTAESLTVPEGAFTKGIDSVLDYTPANDFEYGTLQCLAENAVGIQLEPCVFQIVPAGQEEIDFNSCVLNGIYILTVVKNI